jgi:tRNA dimethylallyltransferase
LIAGPTASGKSALALALAERHGGCVINADALQVYGCWRVLTARPGDAELARAPHMLYGHVGCAVRYSVGAWLRDVAEALAEARRRDLRPIVVGGTGLYLSVLTEGLADIPEVAADIRARSEALLAAGRLDALLADLARDDPATLARIDRGNPMRVQRAWEVLNATGRGLSEWHRTMRPPLVPPAAAVRLVIDLETASLNKCIEMRFNEMLQHGALDECCRFLAAGHPLDAPSGRALGAAQLVGYLQGEVSLEAAVADSITATRQFAKRQRTWFRNRMTDWPRSDPAEALTKVSEIVNATRIC